MLCTMLFLVGCGNKNYVESQKDYLTSSDTVPDKPESKETKSNTLEAVIDGNQRTLELDYAKISAGKILAVYQGYNPRGEKDINICLKLDKNITEGSYSTKNKDREVQIMSGTFMAARAKTSDLAAVGEFTFSLDNRSTDWRTYSGTFSAQLKGEPYTKFASNEMTIENASFNFTLK